MSIKSDPSQNSRFIFPLKITKRLSSEIQEIAKRLSFKFNQQEIDYAFVNSYYSTATVVQK